MESQCQGSSASISFGVAGQCVAGLELQILKGTHFKASAQGHWPSYILKNALKLSFSKAKSKGAEAMASMALV